MPRQLPRVIAFLLLLLTLATGTYWVLAFTSSREESIKTMPLGDTTPRSLPLDISAIARLFDARPQTSAGAIRVLGIIAQGSAGQGIAIVSHQNGTPTTLRAGEEIAANLLLVRVNADGVVIRQSGVESTVAIPVAPAGLNFTTVR